MFFFFFSSRRRHTRWNCDWSSDVCSSDLGLAARVPRGEHGAQEHERQRCHHGAEHGEEGAGLVAQECVAQGQAGEGHVKSPLSSRRWIFALSAACGSWVTITMVLPSVSLSVVS